MQSGLEVEFSDDPSEQLAAKLTDKYEQEHGGSGYVELHAKGAIVDGCFSGAQLTALAAAMFVLEESAPQQQSDSGQGDVDDGPNAQGDEPAGQNPGGG